MVPPCFKSGTACVQISPPAESRTTSNSPDRVLSSLDQFGSVYNTPSLAPNFLARAIFSVEEDVTYTSAPAATANISAARPTPPPIPVISSLVPAFTSPLVNKARYAVNPAKGNAADSTFERCGGHKTICFSSTATHSLSVPHGAPLVLPRMTYRPCASGARGFESQPTPGTSTTRFPRH